VNSAPRSPRGTGRAQLAKLAAALTFIAVAPADAAYPGASAPAYVAEVVNPELAGGLSVPGANALLLWGSDGTILRSEDGAHWSHATTPTVVDLAHVATNATGTMLVAVGAQGVVLLSRDAGRSWQAARNATTDTDLKSVVHHGPSNTWIAAGTNGRILRSQDDGKSWGLVQSNLTLEFQTLAVDPQTQRILIGGEHGALGYSTDAGQSWQLTMIAMPDPATPITAFHRFGKLLLATSALGRFLTSADDAQSWDLLQSSSHAYFTDAAFDPEHDAIVLTGHNGDVLRSADGGATWQSAELSNDGRKDFISAVRFDTRSKSLLAMAQNGAVARSSDGGASWNQASGALGGELRGLLQAADGRFVAFGTGGMVVSSTDSGAHWARAREPLDMYLREIVRVGSDPTFVATSQIGEIIRSTDGGASWQPLRIDYPDSHTPPDLRGLIASPGGAALIAVGPPGTILRSNADASRWDLAHWTPIESERAFPWVLADPQRKIIVAVEARGEMRVSRDDGLQWQPVQVPGAWPDWPFWQGSVLARAGVIIVAGKSGTAARSDDGAQSFRRIDTGTDKDLFGSFADESSGNLFLMGQDGTLLRSADLGLTWRAVVSGSTSELRRMLREPRRGALVCFGGHGAIVRSNDQGLTWRNIVSGTDGVLRKAAFEPGTGSLLLAGSQGALLRSRDAGRRWEALPTHTARHFNSLAVDERSGDLVLVGERIVRLVRQSPRKK
jgi:photosystem II stability/assembly factor-like uncharacterized protein